MSSCVPAELDSVSPGKQQFSRLPLILNGLHAKGEISAGAVEGLNNKVKWVTRKSYGFRTAKVEKLALFHNLGPLPEPEFTHKFC